MKDIMDIFKDMGVFKVENLKDDDFKEPEVAVKQAEALAPVVITEDDLIYLSSVKCPVCDNAFSERTVKKSKLRFIKTDLDLKPYYEVLSPMYYDAQICPCCGYAALSSTFSKITGKTADALMDKLKGNYVNKEYPVILSVDDAIERYKYVLLVAMLRHATEQEKAYIMMKIAWLYRDKGDTEQELYFIENALDGFANNFTSITFPFYGINEITMSYVIAVFCYKVGRSEQSYKWLSSVISNTSTSKALKDKALQFKEMLVEEREEKKKSQTKKPAAKKSQAQPTAEANDSTSDKDDLAKKGTSKLFNPKTLLKKPK